MTNLVEKNTNVNASTLTEREISRLVFEDASVSELRGLSDAFSLEQIKQIADNNDAGIYRGHAMYYLVNLPD